jgi:hypothetical protein
VRAGAPARSLTANAGLAVLSVLCDRLGVIEALEARSARSSGGTRGLGAGAADRDRGGATGREDFVGPDHQRADAAGQRITPVPGRASRTARGMARRITAAHWQTVEADLGVPGRMLSLLQAEIVLATDLRGGTDDPRATTPLTTSTSASRSAPGGPRRCGGCWPASPEDDWHDAIGTDARRPPSPVLPAMVGEHPAADTPGGAGPRPGLRRPAVTASPYPALGPASCRSPDWPWRTWALGNGRTREVCVSWWNVCMRSSDSEG